MKGGLKTRGFTIIETLIVLAVTGGLFLAVAFTISGKQTRTQFEQAINEIKSQIEQTINDVAVGFYPNTNNFGCQAGAFGPVLSSAVNNQGENTGCIFVGKAIQFGIAGTDPEEFRVFTIAGLQRDSTGAETTTYAAAMPRVVAPSTTNPSIPDASVSNKLQYGLITNRVTHGATNVGAIVFANKLASYSSGSIVSGAQQVNVVPVSGSSLNVSKEAAATAINSQLATSPVNPGGGVTICFVSGGSNQSGLITIGSNARQLSVTLSIKEN
ncbi:MAG: type II secretion system protein, partial [Patescibacteria group bacterium]